MARAPAAAAPMPAEDPAMIDGAAMPADDMGAAPEDGQGMDAPQILCTIALNQDGSLVLFEGDEPESMHGGEEAAEGEAGGAPAQTFDGPGQLLKAVLDIVQTAMDGGETGADQMRAGYGEGSEAPLPQA